jgi:hypothetical protein
MKLQNSKIRDGSTSSSVPCKQGDSVVFGGWLNSEVVKAEATCYFANDTKEEDKMRKTLV